MSAWGVRSELAEKIPQGLLNVYESCLGVFASENAAEREKGE